jgi:superfamily I DNA/RNA helicase
MNEVTIGVLVRNNKTALYLERYLIQSDILYSMNMKTAKFIDKKEIRLCFYFI